jgi:hypothetical protein
MKGYPFTGLFFDLDHRAAHVVAALRANHVGGDGQAALRAEMQLLGDLEIMSPARPGTCVRLLAFGDGHGQRFLRTPSSIAESPS